MVLRSCCRRVWCRCVGAGFELGAQLGELVFVVGPAVDGGRGLLVEKADLRFEVGDLLLRAGQGCLRLFKGRQVGAEPAVRAAGCRRGCSRQGARACRSTTRGRHGHGSTHGARAWNRTRNRTRNRCLLERDRLRCGVVSTQTPGRFVATRVGPSLIDVSAKGQDGQRCRAKRARAEVSLASASGFQGGAAGWKGPKEGWLALGIHFQGSCVFALTSVHLSHCSALSGIG